MKLNFGCGDHKLDGFVGVDKLRTKAVDIIHDMNVFPYPFRDDSVEEVLLSNILEHLHDTIKVIEEIYRICRKDAVITIRVPYYHCLGAYSDPTHVKYFTEHSFDYFTEDGATYLSAYNYYTIARFKTISIIPFQRRIFDILPKRFQWFLAHHLSTIHGIEFKLRVVKSEISLYST